MGLFDFLKKDKAKSTEVALKRDEDDDSKSKIGAGIALDSSIRSSTAQANAKFSRPEYNPQTRKQFYDDGSAHKKAIDDAFASGKTVRDPYSGAELVKKQRDAKMQYGEDWQSHAAEADHIDPLSQIAKRTKKNPFLTTDDVREIGNSDDNFQVLSRKLNQGSKDVGKGGSTQQEWADDATRMEGLADNIESGETIGEVSKRIKDTGKAAEKRNNSRALKKGVKNAVGTAHEAGKAGAQSAGITTLTMSGILNITAVIKGEKSPEEALADTAEDTVKSAASGYVMGGGLTVLSHTLSGSSSEFVRALAESNVPGKIITGVVLVGDTLKKYGEGEITTQECIIELGDKGLTFATAGYSMAVGQALIPIPIVGAAVGALVGSTLTSNYYHELVNELQTKEIEHQERLRIIAECGEAARQMQAYREELESYLATYFRDYQHCFDVALNEIKNSFLLGDAEGVVAGANQITRKLGGRVYYDNFDEFKGYLFNGSPDIL